MKRSQTTRGQNTAKGHHSAARPSRRRSSRTEDRLKTILRATTDFYGTWNVSQGPLYLPDPGVGPSGHTVDAQNNCVSLQSLIHPEELASFQSQVEAHLSGKAPELDCEFRLRTKPDAYRWFELRGKTVRNDRRGAVAEIAYAMRDIHGRKQQREEILASHDRAAGALRESDERLRAAIEVGRMYAFEWDAATDVIERFDRDDVWFDIPDTRSPRSRQKLVERIHSEDQQNYIDTLQSLAPERPDYRVVFRLPLGDGRTAWLEESGRAIFSSDGRLRKVLGITSDVTETRQSERALRELSRRLICSQEDERRRIARELHDHIGQEAALLCVQAQRIDSGAAHEEHTTRSDVHELYRRIQVLSTDISKLSHRLHSSELSFLGLAVAAERLCRDFASHYGIAVDCQARSAPPILDSAKSLCLYRVLQEALQNVAKHSHASRVTVTLRKVENRLLMDVTDNGSGFESGATNAINSGLGVLNMRERLDLVAGQLEIISSRGSGTRVTASVMI